MRTDKLDLRTHEYNPRTEKLFSVEDVENGLATEEYAIILHEIKRLTARYKEHEHNYAHHKFLLNITPNVPENAKRREQSETKINRAKHNMDLFEKELEKWEKKKEDYINNVRK